MRILKIVFPIFLCAVCGSCVELDQWWYQNVGDHDDHEISIGRYLLKDPQKDANWCWAACIALTLNDLLRTQDQPYPISQQYVVRKMFGSYVDSGASAQGMVALIDNHTYYYRFEIGNTTIPFFLHARYEEGVPSIDTLKEIESKRDNERVILLIPHHAVTFEKLNYITNGDYTEIKSWDIYDPWPITNGDRTISEADAMSDSGNDRILGMIVISVDRPEN